MSAADALHRGRSPFLGNAAGALLDANGLIVGWTLEAERLLALGAAQVRGRPARDLLADPAGWPSLATLTDQQRADGWSGEAELRSGRGEALAIAYQVLPLGVPSADPPTGPPTGPPEGPTGPGAPARYFVLAAPASQVARSRQDQAFTRELFLQDRVGLAVFDDRLRLIRTNTHLLPYSGLPRTSAAAASATSSSPRTPRPSNADCTRSCAPAGRWSARRNWSAPSRTRPAAP